MHASIDAPTQPQGIAEKAAHEHLKSGGQRVRAKMALDACFKLSVSNSDAVILSACAELIHNASLIHDDVVDQSEWRRGTRTLFSCYGSAVAICTGDLLLSAAYGILSDLSDASKLPQLLKIIHRGIASTVRGQCAEGVPIIAEPKTWNDYELIVVAKSGALLLLPFEMALTVAGNEDHIATAQKAVSAFAIAYQIMDDIQDLEMDRGDDQRLPSFNALLILEAAGDGQGAQKIASKFAESRLTEAIVAASQLPFGSGDLLANISEGMLRRLL